MKDLLEQILKGIVQYEADVRVEQKQSSDFKGLTLLVIYANKEDYGIIIGKHGRTIDAIREIIFINSIRSGCRAKVLINEDDDKNYDDPLNDEI